MMGYDYTCDYQHVVKGIYMYNNKNVFVCFCFYRIEVRIKKIVLLEVCNNLDVIY